MSLNDLTLSLGRRRIAGSDLNTTANAISLTNEADATTGWTATSLTGTGANVFESQGSVKNDGSYAFHANSNDTPTDGARFYTDLNAAPYSCVVGNGYLITFMARHVGTGFAWAFRTAQLTNLTTNNETVATITPTVLTFTLYTYFFVHSANTRYFGAKENSPSNDGGIYFDSFTIQQVS